MGTGSFVSDYISISKYIHQVLFPFILMFTWRHYKDDHSKILEIVVVIRRDFGANFPSLMTQGVYFAQSPWSCAALDLRGFHLFGFLNSIVSWSTITR